MQRGDAVRVGTEFGGGTTSPGDSAKVRTRTPSRAHWLSTASVTNPPTSPDRAAVPIAPIRASSAAARAAQSTQANRWSSSAAAAGAGRSPAA